MGGGLYLVVRESGERMWAFRFTGLDGRRAQMEFAKVGDRDSASGDVLTLSSARDKAREYKVALRRDGVDPRVKKRATIQGGKTFIVFAEEQYPTWCQGLSEEELKQWQRSMRDDIWHLALLFLATAPHEAHPSWSATARGRKWGIGISGAALRDQTKPRPMAPV